MKEPASLYDWVFERAGRLRTSSLLVLSTLGEGFSRLPLSNYARSWAAFARNYFETSVDPRVFQGWAASENLFPPSASQ
jgi:hypothetical protein